MKMQKKQQSTVNLLRTPSSIKNCCMALILSSEVDKEARRIVASQNAFDVLGLTPADANKDSVLKRYEEKVTLFRRLVRNSLAMEAKSRLDHAKVLLLDDNLRSKESVKFNESLRSTIIGREELKALEARTKLLEDRAAVLSL